MTGMARMTYSALIFDLDGVLADTEPLHKEAKRDAFRSFGLEIPEPYYLDFRGRTDEDFARIVGRELGLDEGRCEEVLRRKHALFEARETEIPPVAGVLDFLREARGRFAKLAVATSATPRNQAFAFDRFGLHPFFDAVVNASHITHAKPHPEPYLKAAELLGIPTSDCLVIEDSRNGILSGKSAGCAVAAITTSYSRAELLGTPADLVVDGYPELAARLGF